ncbi:hypothetical protein [Roseospira visakhapatnamensis]|uniref:Uncharacterized protein n=1 Tax=Roseospira visakhapatnamensis TaxID=390880 RepID=A0A7W6RH31_9PROT|nr:hypothetical protein [Roseospira visakhapatnamensis]MBB4267914.1 hypothetical protein [Roseospira visakhapatnamensis]
MPGLHDDVPAALSRDEALNTLTDITLTLERMITVLDAIYDNIYYER